MLQVLLEYTFIWKGVIGALLASICAGIAGSYIVSRKIVFLSGGITHASFGGIGIGHWAGFSPVAGAGAFGVVAALTAEYLSGNKKMSEDSAIGILWALGMAIGIIFIYITPGYAPNLMSYLFGSILTVTTADLVALGVICAVLILYFLLFYRTLLYIAFDEGYARTWSPYVDVFRYVTIALIAITIVLNIRMAGVILVLSLFTIPPNVVMLFTRKFISIVLWSTVVSFAGVLTGYAISFNYGIPTGATIIFTLVVIYLFCRLAVEISGKKIAKRNIERNQKTDIKQ